MIDITLREFDEKPTLSIPQDKYKQINAYIALADGEISWLFDVDYDKETETFRMGNVYLLKQEATAASTDMDEEAISKFLYEQIKKGVDQMPRGWGHSHAHMGTFFSGTDRHAISDELANDTFFVSIVCNKAKQIKGNLRISTPYGMTLSLDDIEIEVENNEEWPEEYRKEVAEKVQTRKWFGGYDNDKGDDTKGGSLIFGKKIKDGEKPKKFLGKVSKLGKKKKIQFFPKDAAKAAKLIDDLELVQFFDTDLEEWIWLRQSDGTIYRDLHQVVPGIDAELAARTKEYHDA